MCVHWENRYVKIYFIVFLAAHFSIKIALLILLWPISAIWCLCVFAPQKSKTKTRSYSHWSCLRLRRHKDTIHFRRNDDIIIGEDTRSSAELSCRRVEIFVSAPYICRVFASKGEFIESLCRRIFAPKAEDTIKWSIIVSSHFAFCGGDTTIWCADMECIAYEDTQWDI
jgi:hypothetical protein